MPTQPSQAPTLRDRLAALMREARSAAGDHLCELEQALQHVAQLSADIAEGGHAYPVGVRAVARQLREQSQQHNKLLNSLGAALRA